MRLNAIELSLFQHRLSAICDEMGAILRRSAISPNIRDREDYSCALFAADGALVSQAAHIPIHLGSMAFCMHRMVDGFDWRTDDAVIFNDPFPGGTHLPDVTLVMPLLLDNQVQGFAAVRAHHVDIGGTAPGSMGLAQRLDDEGMVITPRYWYRAGECQPDVEQQFRQRVKRADEGLGDLSAQHAACRIGIRRLQELSRTTALAPAMAQLLDQSCAYGRSAIAALPDGEYHASDAIEDDGFGHAPLPLRLTLRIHGEQATLDFSGSSEQSAGPLNCPLAVTAAAVLYGFRCLMPPQTPQTSAIFRNIKLIVPEGTLLNANPGAAVAAGSVETSQRVVDLLLAALACAVPERIPAAAQGTMNNIIFAGDGWTYYETLAGGMGAHAHGNGLSAVQCHMTNTRNTAIEVLEMYYPLRIERYTVRRGSGGEGRYRGGDGLIRRWHILQPCRLSLLTERRQSAPYGLQGGSSGKPGSNRLCRDGVWQTLPAKCELKLQTGDRVEIATPGGGGFGRTP